MRNLVQGLSWQPGWARQCKLPSKSAIFQARARLAVEALQLAFDRGCVLLATTDRPGACYRGWRLGRDRWDDAGGGGHASQRRGVRSAGQSAGFHCVPSVTAGRVH